MLDDGKTFLLFGGGGHAAVVYEAALASGWNCAAVFDDDEALQGVRFMDEHSIRTSQAELMHFLASGVRHAFPAIGGNAAREAIADRLSDAGFLLPTIIHPSATVSPSARLGNGVAVMAGAVVQARTEIEDGVVVNTMASIDHDCHISAFSHIAPGARLCGGVAIGRGSRVGVGASLIPCVRVDAGTVIGAGAAVIGDLVGGGMWAGCPAVKKS